MGNLVTKETADWFARNVFVPGHDLLLTILVDRGDVKASINIDGPFHIARFFLGRPDEEDVIEPLCATRRHKDDPETNVHMHVVNWRGLNWCRVWHEPNPRIGYDRRICFFRHPARARKPWTGAILVLRKSRSPASQSIAAEARQLQRAHADPVRRNTTAPRCIAPIVSHPLPEARPVSTSLLAGLPP